MIAELLGLAVLLLVSVAVVGVVLRTTGAARSTKKRQDDVPTLAEAIRAKITEKQE
ncbi:MAG TPA: hypothetical protein V6C81_11410 [Planktothrix sp.]|jgi:hypothetical protein